MINSQLSACGQCIGQCRCKKLLKIDRAIDNFIDVPCPTDGDGCIIPKDCIESVKLMLYCPTYEKCKVKSPKFDLMIGKCDCCLRIEKKHIKHMCAGLLSFKLIVKTIEGTSFMLCEGDVAIK